MENQEILNKSNSNPCINLYHHSIMHANHNLTFPHLSFLKVIKHAYRFYKPMMIKAYYKTCEDLGI